MAAHFQQENRQSQAAAKPVSRASSRYLRFLSVGRLRLGGLFHMSGIAYRGSRVQHLVRCHRAFSIAHPGRFRGEIDFGGNHAGHRLQRLFHPADAGGAGHVVDPKHRLGNPRRIAGLVERAL